MCNIINRIHKNNKRYYIWRNRDMKAIKSDVITSQCH